jgi:hypothetical protein
LERKTPDEFTMGKGCKKLERFRKIAKRKPPIFG